MEREKVERQAGAYVQRFSPYRSPCLLPISMLPSLGQNLIMAAEVDEGAGILWRVERKKSDG